jgi:hypothetical protein
MKALSIHQPWADLYLGPKPVENRSRPTRYRGTLAIHATQTFDHDGHAWLKENFPQYWKPQEAYTMGAIVGTVCLSGCVREYVSPWFTGPWGWVRTVPIRLHPIPWKGHQGLWTVPTKIIRTARVDNDV